jgi:peptide deformylase
MAIIIPKQVGTKEGTLLFQKAEEVKDVSEGKTIAKSLKDTLGQYKGVGLAAPQIGISKRVFAINIHPSNAHKKAPAIGFKVYINPKIITVSSDTNKDYEGCLSLFYGTVYALVRRSNTLTIQYTDVYGEEKTEQIVHPFQSRVILHENDHLDGSIFLQRLRKKDFSTLIWNEKVTPNLLQFSSQLGSYD